MYTTCFFRHENVKSAAELASMHSASAQAKPRPPFPQPEIEVLKVVETTPQTET